MATSRPDMRMLEVDGRPVSWVRDGTLKGRPLLVLAHGAGASYHSPFMVETARGLVERGLCVVRFHFPYMELAHTSGTRRPPDPKGRLLATWRALFETARRMRGHGPLFVGGKSMGGRIASMLLAEGGAEEARGAVYLGYPLHPAGRQEKLRADHLPDVPVPQLFVQGSRDPMCQPDIMKRTMKQIRKRVPGSRLVEVEGGDHSLATSRRAPMAGAERWLDEVAAFVRENAG